MLAIHYYKENEDEFTKREIEPYRLANGPEGWYVASYDRKREDIRHFRLDRIKEAEVTDEAFEPRQEFADIAAIEGGWLSGEQVPPPTSPASGSRPSAPAGRARTTPWSRSSPTAPSSSRCPTAAPTGCCARSSKGAGEFVVLEPDEAREAIHAELEADAAAHPAAVKAA